MLVDEDSQPSDSTSDLHNPLSLDEIRAPKTCGNDGKPLLFDSLDRQNGSRRRRSGNHINNCALCRDGPALYLDESWKKYCSEIRDTRPTRRPADRVSRNCPPIQSVKMAMILAYAHFHHTGCSLFLLFSTTSKFEPPDIHLITVRSTRKIVKSFLGP